MAEFRDDPLIEKKDIDMFINMRDSEDNPFSRPHALLVAPEITDGTSIGGDFATTHPPRK